MKVTKFTNPYAQRIYCPYCGIVEIEPKAFHRLTNLVELDLSENAMREVPTEAWKHTKALMRLNLSGNPIKLIRYVSYALKQNRLKSLLMHCVFIVLFEGNLIACFLQFIRKY